MSDYPAHLVNTVTLRDGSQVTVRPIRPEDAAIEQAFVRGLSEESRYFRFMDSLRELTPDMLAHFTRVDYDRHMALIAVTRREGADTEIGVARYVVGRDGASCEFAIVVGDTWQHRGVGVALMRALIDSARHHGLRLMYGEVLSSNHRMLAFTHRLGFHTVPDASDPRVVRVELPLVPYPAHAANPDACRA